MIVRGRLLARRLCYWRISPVTVTPLKPSVSLQNPTNQRSSLDLPRLGDCGGCGEPPLIPPAPVHVRVHTDAVHLRYISKRTHELTINFQKVSRWKCQSNASPRLKCHAIQCRARQFLIKHGCFAVQINTRRQQRGSASTAQYQSTLDTQDATSSTKPIDRGVSGQAPDAGNRSLHQTSRTSTRSGSARYVGQGAPPAPQSVSRVKDSHSLVVDGPPKPLFWATVSPSGAVCCSRTVQNPHSMGLWIARPTHKLHTLSATPMHNA